MIFRGLLSIKEAVNYILSQLTGAFLAAIFVQWVGGSVMQIAPNDSVSVMQILAVESIFTFALVLVILNVATNPKTEGNSYYGLAIGFTVMAGAFAGGGISGGAYNPAVGTGPILVDAIMGEGNTLSNLRYYIVGPIIGAVIGNPLAIGVMLMVMVYMGGHISGAHYNPAVSIAMIFRGLLTTKEAINYILSQLIGAFLAAIFVQWVGGAVMEVGPSNTASVLQILSVEAIFTFALVLVILNVATNPKTEGNSYYGLGFVATFNITKTSAKVKIASTERICKTEAVLLGPTSITAPPTHCTKIAAKNAPINWERI
jgi:glycerol uptake facilitator-like aquaporin